MKLRETLDLPVSASAASAMYADESYAEVRRASLGASSASATVQGDPSGAFVVRTELAMPTDRVPDIVRPFVGSSVTVREEQSWSAPASDGSRTGTMKLDVAGTRRGGERVDDADAEGRGLLHRPDRRRPHGEGPADRVAPGEGGGPPTSPKVLRTEEKAAAKYRDSQSA